MNFGQTFITGFYQNAQSLVLLAIVVIGLYLGFKREFSKLIGFFNYCDYCGWLSLQRCWSKRHFTRAIQSHYWCLNKTVLFVEYKWFSYVPQRNGTPNEVR